MELFDMKPVLEAKGYKVSCFKTGSEAVCYLNEMIDNTSAGFGGSVTLEELGLYDVLASHNEVIWHHRIPEGQTSQMVRDRAIQAKVYLSSVNGMSEDGQLVNIDNASNRVSAIFYGHEKVYLVIGNNKLSPTLDEAIFRARNYAAPLNAQRLGLKTPCALKAERCYDCKSPQRICRSLSIMMMAPAMSNIEVILIDQKLGY